MLTASARHGIGIMAETATEPAQGSNATEFSVSELAGAIKRQLEDGFGYVRLRGEISGYRGPHGSGHCYFGLKDERARIDAVIWRGVFSKLKVKPEEGMEVIAHGRITTYPNSSKYQIVVEALEPAGVGALMALLEERKKKFAAEGLFDEARKRPLPFLPRVIGIVTSPTGAVIRDMLHGFNERYPAHVIVWPVRVQGESCAAEVANAIDGFNALLPDGPVKRPDILIVARGGGSLEDLWGFNEEVVVRAAAASEIPLISAVGHETDWTLIDLVADARAPTPTKAAEWAAPKYSELVARQDEIRTRLRQAIRRAIETARVSVRAASRGLPRLEDLVAMPRQRFDAAERRLASALLANTRVHGTRLARVGARLSPRLVATRLERARDALEVRARRAGEALRHAAQTRRAHLMRLDAGLRPQMLRQRLGVTRERLDGFWARLQRALLQQTANRRSALDTQSKLLASLSHHGVLRRGFALVRDGDGRAVRSAAATEPGQSVAIEFHDGIRGARIGTGETSTPGAPSPGSRSEPQRRTPARSSAKSRSPRGSSGGSSGGQGSLF